MARSSTTFNRGHKAMGGRPPGSLNRATREIRELARLILRKRPYLARLRRRLIDGKAPHMETLLFQYAYGRPGPSPTLAEIAQEETALKEIAEDRAAEEWMKLPTEERIRRNERDIRFYEAHVRHLREGTIKGEVADEAPRNRYQ